MEVEISAEIMEHARGLVTVDLSEPARLAAAMTAYQCKLYRARLNQASESRHTTTLRPVRFEAAAGRRVAQDFIVR